MSAFDGVAGEAQLQLQRPQELEQVLIPGASQLLELRTSRLT